MQNLVDSFSKLVSENFIKYKGILVEKSGKGFTRKGIYYPTIAALDIAIDISVTALTNSLNKTNHAKR